MQATKQSVQRSKLIPLYLVGADRYDLEKAKYREEIKQNLIQYQKK